MQEAAEKIGSPERFRLIDLAIRFDARLTIDLRSRAPLQRDPSTMQLNNYGVMQGTCYHCGMCDIGCDVNARNTLDTNYIPRAEQQGATVRPLHLVTNIEPVPGGYRVWYDRLEQGTRVRGGSETARIVIVAAGSLGSTELLLRCRHVTHTLRQVSPCLGQHWSSNGDFLTPAFHPDREVSPTPWYGPPITSVIDFLDRSQHGQSFWIQDGGFPDLLAQYLEKLGGAAGKGPRAWIILEAISHLLQSKNPVQHMMPWFAQAVDASDGVLSLKRRGRLKSHRLHLTWASKQSRPAMDAVVQMHKQLAEATGGRPHVPVTWSIFRNLITPHPLGGCGMGEGPTQGVVNHTGEVFGYKNLYVVDAAIFPRAIGVNLSRTIGALAERTAKIIIDENR